MCNMLSTVCGFFLKAKIELFISRRHAEWRDVITTF